MQWPTLRESRSSSCRWNKNQECCLPTMRKESKDNIGWKSKCIYVYWRCKAVSCKSYWLDFTQARKLASSSDIRVGKLCIVAFLLLPDGLHSVCLGLAYLAKQMYNLCMEDLGLFWQPCQTVDLIPAPLVAQMLLGSAVLSACVWSSPDSLGL